VRDNELVLGPFQGPEACFRIAYGRGVCGTAWAQRRTIVVPDVEQFPGHIACSSDSRSEIVVPLWRRAADSHAPSGLRMTEGECPVGVLDIDSANLGTFDSTDATWLELIAQII